MSIRDDSTILVAGAAGFIPGHLCQFYLERGMRVFGLDNFITGSKETISLLEKYPRFEFIECDLIQGVPSFKGTRFDFIFSMASPASPIDFQKIPLEIMQVNSQGTLHLLQLAQEHGARFLEASTSEVYGDPEVHPQVESYVGHVNVGGPRACYDESKRFAESLTHVFHRHYGVDTRIVRIFNTYGPRMRPNDGRIIPNFINQALRDLPVTIYGDGSQTRSYCFVDDLVEAIDQVMFHALDSMPYNIGNTDEKSVLETAKAIISALDSKSPLVFTPLPEDDPKRRRPSLEKVQKETSFVPKISFEEGILRTAQFFKSL